MSGDPLHDQIIKAGAALVAALAEEASLSMRCCKHPDDDALLVKWAQARQRVEECRRAYSGSVEEADYPDLEIRSVVEILMKPEPST